MARKPRKTAEKKPAEKPEVEKNSPPERMRQPSRRVVLESRFPGVNPKLRDKTKDMAVSLTGKWPESLHAQTDMLDEAAVRKAVDLGHSIVAAAPEALFEDGPDGPTLTRIYWITV